MPSISESEFAGLLQTFTRESLHLETRDAYGTETELPYMAKWSRGEPDDLAWLADWCATLRAHTARGATVRRARIVSEPLSAYQRWSHSIAQPMVDAGEDIRWVPRRLVSSIGIPGNDFYLLDDHLAVFLIYTGDGLNASFETSTDPADLSLCRSAFEAVWKVAVPHREYQPV
ncbi:DUF6879 family protein [Catenuloplanes japonicus]|uniref:DUF6879 family protein n=1 Tax=Catenuloplanes japonicus TaxID=33876 RepID=UPI0005274D29|nr:DUF6879 family protein [Catenuloplanes japonicus]